MISFKFHFIHNQMDERMVKFNGTWTQMCYISAFQQLAQICKSSHQGEEGLIKQDYKLIITTCTHTLKSATQDYNGP